MAGIPFTPIARGMNLAEIQSAEWFNAIARLNQTLTALSVSQSGGGVRTGGVDYSQVLIRNNSGAHGPMFGILGIDDGFEISPDDNLDAWKDQPILKGVEPTEDHVGRFVILTQPIPEGEIGSCYVAGIITQIDVQNEGHEYADITEGEIGYLTSGESGLCRIIQKQGPPAEEPEVGEPDLRWALVAYGGGGGGGDCDCPRHFYQIRFQIVNTSGTPTYNLVMVVNGTPYGVNSIAIASSAATIKAAIEAVFTANPTPFAGFEVYTNGGSLPGTSVGVRFVVPDSVVFSFSRGTQSATTFLVRVDPMTAPEIP